ncbi:MAG: hypothetical protein R3F56_24450 [Planctomycetota bacterium]
MQYQQVHSATSFSSGGPLTVTGLSLRPRSNTAAAIDMELFMADCPYNAFDAHDRFADNVVAGTEVNVLLRRRVSLPATTNVDWLLRLPFDNSFAWSGSHLSWRLVNYDTYNGGSPTYYSCDAFSNFGNWTQSGTFQGCSSPSSTQPPEHLVRIRGPGATSTFDGYSYVASGGLPAILMIGTAPQAIDLTPFGAPGCVLTNDVAGTLTGTTRNDTEGSVSFVLPIPRARSFVGFTFQTQIAFYQPSANSLGLFFTPGSTNVLGNNFDVTRIPGSVGATQGSVEVQYGLGIGLN